MDTRHHAGSTRRRVGSLLAGAALLLAPAALAAPASAASLSVDKPCYVFSKHKPALMTISGAGFMPGDQVTISSGDGWAGTSGVIADASGAFSVSVQAPQPPFGLPGQQTVTLTAVDLAPSGTITATAPATVAPLGVSTVPSQAPLSHKLTWYLSGFAPGKYIYVHYLHRKPVARARLGLAKGPCGVLKTRAHVYPSLHPRYRRYSVQIDDARRYSNQAAPKIDTTLNIFNA